MMDNPRTSITQYPPNELGLQLSASALEEILSELSANNSTMMNSTNEKQELVAPSYHPDFFMMNNPRTSITQNPPNELGLQLSASDFDEILSANNSTMKASSSNEKQELLPSFFDDLQAKPFGLDEMFTKTSKKISIVNDRIILVTERDLGTTEDGYCWIPVNSTNLRHEFKCIGCRCPVKKIYELSTDGQQNLVTTYDGKHNHPPIPPLSQFRPPPPLPPPETRISASCLMPESSTSFNPSAITSYRGSSSSSVLPEPNFSSQLYPLPDEQLLAANQQLIQNQLHPLPQQMNLLPHQKFFLGQQTEGPNQGFFHDPEDPSQSIWGSNGI